MTAERTWTNIDDPESLNFARLAWHCGVKGVQLGAVVGTAVVTPLTIFLAARNKVPINYGLISRRLVYSMAGGSVFALGMMMAKYVGWENKKVALQDRAYRIHYNQGQARVDKITEATFAFGFLGSLFVTQNVTMSLGFAAPAIVAGILIHVATKPKPDS